MNNLIKKSFLISMMVLTVFGMFGFFGLNVSAANVATANSLVKIQGNSSVYFLDSNNLRHPIPDERVYFSWYQDFGGVVTIPVDEMTSYNLGSPVLVRPGTRLVQFVSFTATGFEIDDPKVYAVGANNVISHIDSPATAVSFFGTNWENRITAVSNLLFSNYTSGTALTSSSKYPTGSLVKMGSTTYYIDGSNKRAVTDAGFTANRFDTDFVLTATSLTGYSDGTSVTAAETALMYPTATSATPTTPTSGTGLTVALAAGTPAGTTVPKGATSVKASTYNFTASNDGPVTVSSLDVVRGGVGANADINRVYVYEGANRLTSGRTLNSDGKASMNLNYAIPAGTTKTLTIVFDVVTSPSSTGGLHNFYFSNIVASATVTGSTPAGNTFVIGGTSAASFTMATNNTHATDPDTNPKVGEDGIEIADFDIDTVANEDIALTGFTLTNGGNSRVADLSNIKLMYNGTSLANGTFDGTKVVFTFAEVTLKKDQSNYNFQVRADIEGGINNYTKLYFDEKSDIIAVGKTYGFNIDSTITSMDTSSEAWWAKVGGGTITVNFKADQTATILNNQTDYVWATLDITAPEDINIREMMVTVDETDGAANGVIDLTNLEMKNLTTGVIYSGTINSGNGDNAATDVLWKFQNIIWAAGTHSWQIRADIPNNATAADGYNVKVVFTANYTAEYASSREAITAATHLSTTTLTGKVKTIGAASLTVVPGAFNNTNAVINDTDVVIAGGYLQTGTYSSVKVTAMAFKGASTTPVVGPLTDANDDLFFDQTNVATVGLYVDPDNDGNYTLLKSRTGNALTNGEVTFDDFGSELVIPSNSKVNFLVKLNVSNVLDVSNTSVRVHLTSVTATDGNNNTVAAANAAATAISATARVDFGRLVSLQGSGVLDLSWDNSVSGVDQNKYVLAGTAGNKITRLKAVAQYEAVKVTKLVLTNANSTSDDSAASVKIYKANGAALGDLVVSQNLLSNTVTFEDANGLFTVPVGTTYYFVVVDLNKIGINLDAADSGDAYALTIVSSAANLAAQGASTGVELAIDNSGANTGLRSSATSVSNTSTVVAVKVASLTDVTSAALKLGAGTSGQEVLRFRINLDTSVTNGSTTSNGDELKFRLLGLAVTLNYNQATMSTTAVDGVGTQYLRLDRIGKSGYATASIGATGNKSTFAFATTTLDNQPNTPAWTVANNQEISVADAYAEFKLTVKKIRRATADNSDYVQASIANIDGSSGTLGTNYDVQWHDGTGIHSTNSYRLLLGSDELVGRNITP